MISKAPEREDFYFSHYINKCTEDDLFDALDRASKGVIYLFNSIPTDLHNYAYAEGKWTVKEVLTHLIDTERILIYRALCFSRKETAVLPGFDEDTYAALEDVSEVTLDTLLEEYKTVRQSTIQLFKRMSTSGLDFEGNANNTIISSRELGWTIAGHDLHHCEVLKERYL